MCSGNGGYRNGDGSEVLVVVIKECRVSYVATEERERLEACRSKMLDFSKAATTEG